MEREKETLEKGGFASAYLNRWQLQALEDVAHAAGLTRFYYVQRLLLSHLIEEGKLPSSDLERAVDKWKKRQLKPHGNSKEVREAILAGVRERRRAGSKEEDVTPVRTPAPAPAPAHEGARKERMLAKRRERRRRTQ